MKRGWVFLWLMIIGLALQAQELVLRHIDEERGLPSNFVLDLHFDREGMLWVGTNQGLYRYDGFSFERIGVGTELDRCNVVGMIEGAGSGEFFFSCYGHRLFHYWKGKVDECVNDLPLRPYLDAGSYTNLAFDEQGDLWMASSHAAQVFVLDTATGAFRSELTDEKQPVVAWNGRRYVGRTGARVNGGMDSLLVHWKERRISLAVPGTKANLGRCPLPVHGIAGELFVLVDDMIVRIDQNGRSTMRHFGDHVMGCSQDAQGQVWVRVFNQGLFCLDSALKDLPFRSSQLRNDQVTDALEDPRGGMWFSSTTRGLFYCPEPAVRSWPSEQVFGVPEVSALAVDSIGRLYVGCSNGLVQRLNTDASITMIVGPERVANSGEVKGIVFLKDGKIMAGGLSNVYDPVNERLIHEPGLSRYSVLYDAVHLSGQRYLSGSTARCILLDLSQAPAFTDTLDGLRTFRFCRMGTSNDHWVATHRGLYAYREEGFSKVDPGDSLLQRRTYDLLTMGDTLLLATDRGLIIYRNGRSEVLLPASFPPDVQVRDLYLQHNGHLWCATLNGLYCLRRATPRAPALRIGRPQGLPSDAVYKVTGIGERIWCIAGSDLCSFSTNEVGRQRSAGPLSILGFQVGQTFHAGATGSTFERSVDHLTILLRQVDYARFNSVAFRYRQAGREEWTVTEHPAVDLISLRPGDHRVEIQAADANGVWGESVFASWTIAIPFWNRAWFVAAVVFVCMSVLGLLIAWVQLRRRREAGLRAMAERYHHKALLAQMEPHFLYNALNAIQGFVARNDVDASQRYLAKFAKLMRGLLQAAHHEQVTLNEEMAMLENYCALEALRSEPPFTFAIKAGPDLDTTDILLPSFLMQPYVENAARHGVRNLRGERAGHVDVRFSAMPNERLLCEVEDNGVGRERAQQLTDKGVAWRSHGTRINAERAHLLTKGDKNGGVHIVVSDVTTAGEVVGTRVSISLPLMRQEKARQSSNM